MFHTVFTDISNIYLKHRRFIYLYRCFIQHLPMCQIYISNTDVSYIYTDVSYSTYRCFKYISPMFHTIFTDVSYSIYRCFIQYLPMFQIYISNTDVSYIYTYVSYSFCRCFKYISQTPMFHISLPMVNTVFTDVSNIYTSNIEF
jgi:hypothetical protein